MSAAVRSAFVRSTRPITSVLLAVSLAAGAAAQPAPAVPAPLPDDTLFRVFLTDGSAVASVGELTRVGDRVVFSLPLSSARQPVVSVPAADVDWPRTNRYTEAVRAARYAATRGESDFAAMSALVARTLTDITVTPGVDAQLALAERARRTLADWPRDHYGYRAEEVRQTLSLLDEVVGGLRAAAGQTRFDVSLVAATAPAPLPEPVVPPPTLKEAIEQALGLAARASSAAERTVLLEQAQSALADAPASSGPSAWRSQVEEQVGSALESERRTDRAYGNLVAETIQASDRRAARHDVRGLMAIRDRVVERDRRLGSRRPEEIQALLSAIDHRLDAVRRHRLAYDRWKSREPVLRRYRETVQPWLVQLRRLDGVLTDIRALAGPSATRLSSFVHQLDTIGPVLRRLTVPEEARDAHTAALGAVQLSQTAAAQRARAVAGTDMRVAWDASAAAAGALLFLERAEAALVALARPSP